MGGKREAVTYRKNSSPVRRFSFVYLSSKYVFLFNFFTLLH